MTDVQQALSLRRRLGVAGRDDRGASSIELVIYTPLIMLVMFVAVQFALSWHGNQIAGAVAREAARVARTEAGAPGSVAAAEAAGLDYATAIGGKALTDVTVEVTLLPAQESVTVTVTGRASEIVQGLSPRVSATVEGPLETFRPDL